MSKRVVLMLVVLMTATCTRWSRTNRALTEPIPERRAIQVWEGSTGHSLHAVQITDDSLSGIPRWKSPDCDNCRITIAKNDIDSIRIHTFSRARTTGAVTGGVLLGGSILAVAAAYCNSDSPCSAGMIFFPFAAMAGIGTFLGYLLGSSVDR